MRDPNMASASFFPCMIHAKTTINCCLSSKMSTLHQWMVCFDLPMSQEVFNLLHKEIIGITRYGVEVEKKNRRKNQGQWL